MLQHLDSLLQYINLGVAVISGVAPIGIWLIDRKESGKRNNQQILDEIVKDDPFYAAEIDRTQSHARRMLIWSGVLFAVFLLFLLIGIYLRADGGFGLAAFSAYVLMAATGLYIKRSRDLRTASTHLVTLKFRRLMTLSPEAAEKYKLSQVILEIERAELEKLQNSLLRSLHWMWIGGYVTLGAGVFYTLIGVETLIPEQNVNPYMLGLSGTIMFGIWPYWLWRRTSTLKHKIREAKFNLERKESLSTAG